MRHADGGHLRERSSGRRRRALACAGHPFLLPKRQRVRDLDPIFRALGDGRARPHVGHALAETQPCGDAGILRPRAAPPAIGPGEIEPAGEHAHRRQPPRNWGRWAHRRIRRIPRGREGSRHPLRPGTPSSARLSSQLDGGDVDGGRFPRGGWSHVRQPSQVEGIRTASGLGDTRRGGQKARSDRQWRGHHARPRQQVRSGGLCHRSAGLKDRSIPGAACGAEPFRRRVRSSAGQPEPCRHR